MLLHDRREFLQVFVRIIPRHVQRGETKLRRISGQRGQRSATAIDLLHRLGDRRVRLRGSRSARDEQVRRRAAGGAGLGLPGSIPLCSSGLKFFRQLE